MEAERFDIPRRVRPERTRTTASYARELNEKKFLQAHNPSQQSESGYTTGYLKYRCKLCFARKRPQAPQFPAMGSDLGCRAGD